MKDINIENYKHRWKKLKNTQINGKNPMLMDWKPVKTSIPPKTIYRFNAIPIKISMVFLIIYRKNNPKMHIKPERPQIAKAIWKKNNKAWGIIVLKFKI